MAPEPPEKPEPSTTAPEAPPQPAPTTTPETVAQPELVPAQAATSSTDASAGFVAAEGAKFPVVGIGASAGGLEALELLTRRLSSDGMAFIVLQHLAPAHESVLTEILARGTSLKVVTVEDGTVIAPNRIYVTPPNVDIVLEQGVLRFQPPSERLPRQSIDTLLRTLATDLGAWAIGVILSGAGTDGALGLRAIKEEGGITFVQDPKTAGQPSMPQAAIDLGVADYCLSPAEIADELMRLSAHPFVARKRPAHFLSQDSLGRLFEMLRRAFGVDFSAYKLATVERRIARRMVLQKVEKLDDYLRFLDSNAAELAVLYADLLIGVTNFFRDREPFDALKSVVFPRLFEKRSTGTPIRIWVPGCASGEEAYSIAICLVEYLDHLPGAHRIQIFATDIDDHALARARQATYPRSIEVDVSPERLQRFFTRHDKGYEVARPIRDMVVFARHNLGKDPPFSRLDLVSCRNVLIYMTAPLQRKVLRVFHYALNPDAFLLLGASESVGEASDQFTLIDRKLKIYLKKNVPSAAVFDFAAGAQMSAEVQAPSMPVIERRAPISIQALADRKVLEKFAPPGLLLDENQDVIQFRGDTGPYLAPAPGMATLNVLKLVRPELMLELRSTLQRVENTGLPQVSDVIRLKSEPSERLVVLDIMLLVDRTQKRCYLVVFREQPTAPPVAPPQQPAETVDVATQARIQELEREILVTKEYLQTTVQELEAANEELQSSNEELQSSNEELQSTNEELETSKEELQSTNEELATVNEELQNRMVQLNIASDDLNNVISSVTTSFVIVGMDLRIRVFSIEAERLLNLIAGDVGRPIAQLGASLNAPQIGSLVSDTINMVRERSLRVRCSDGHWYTARMIPYRTSDHAIRGALIEFLRAAPSRKVGEVPEIHELATKVLSTLPNVVLLLDDQLRIVWVNKTFFDEFQTGAEILGKSLDEVWAGRATHPELWNALEENIASGKPFTGVWVSHPFGRASDRPMMFSARRIGGEGERATLALVVMENAGGSASP